MAFDPKSLRSRDRMIVGGGGVAFIAACLRWWGYTGPLHLYGPSIIGWNAGFTAWLGSLLLTAAGAYLLLLRSKVSLPSLPFGPAVTVAGRSAIGLALVLLRWLTLPRVHPALAANLRPTVRIWAPVTAAHAHALRAVLHA